MLQPTDVGRRGTSQWKIAVCESAAHKDKGIANSSEIKLHLLKVIRMLKNMYNK